MNDGVQQHAQQALDLPWLALDRDSRPGALIAFEGVDGAGKSTVIAAVARHLRERGHRVYLPREGKEHSSRSTRMIRRLTRDRRNLDLSARAELLLYCAREGQVLHELVRPALARGEVVLTDRSLLTPIVLGQARGLSAEDCAQAASVATDGLEPDLTLVFDVHPRTSRLRKRLARIEAGGDEEGGRKGLAGSGFKARMRDLYSEVAEQRRYPLFHVERATEDQLCERVVRVIEHGPQIGVGETDADRQPHWLVPAQWDLQQALASLPPRMALFLSKGLVMSRALRATHARQLPTLVAWAMDVTDPLRETLAEVAPDHALRGQARRPWQGATDLRARLLERAPRAVLSALRHQSCAETDAIRHRLVKTHPDGVLVSLSGREDPEAKALRDLCWPLGSERARATSLLFCHGEDAWERRQALFAKHPVAGLGTLRGIRDARADAWLERYQQVAPKRVLRALSGRRDDDAYRLREALYSTGREVIQSVKGLEDERAWDLRERAVGQFPSTVVHSLVGVADQMRASALIERALTAAPGDVHVLRRVQAMKEWPSRPEWARMRAGLEDDEDD